MGKIHIIALLIFGSHVSLGMEINAYVDKDFKWTELYGVHAYELLSYAFPYSLNYYWMCLPCLLDIYYPRMYNNHMY